MKKEAMLDRDHYAFNSLLTNEVPLIKSMTGRGLKGYSFDLTGIDNCLGVQGKLKLRPPRCSVRIIAREFFTNAFDKSKIVTSKRQLKKSIL
jgi:hypothetical protein